MAVSRDLFLWFGGVKKISNFQFFFFLKLKMKKKKRFGQQLQVDSLLEHWLEKVIFYLFLLFSSNCFFFFKDPPKVVMAPIFVL